MSGTLLVVEDQDTARQSLSELLRDEGYEVHEAADGDAALKMIDDHSIDLVLTDLLLPGADGIAVLKHVRDISPQTLVILMTAHATVETAVEAIHLGAQDYLLKPLIFDDVLLRVRRLMDYRSLAWEAQMLRKEVNRHFSTDQPVGRSKVMREIFALIEKVAPTPATVLITGESGVGKEVITRALHRNSLRHNKVFLPINCSAIPETLLESQLFGHVRGAFTGATNSQEGLFQRASGGTIFLDEIGEMPPALQPKLLRVLEERKVLPVGSTNPVKIDVRIVASTNRDLEEEVAAGRFREDLFYRLNVIGIYVPPLRERREDIPPLVEHLIQRHNQEMNLNYKGADNATTKKLMSLPWKGNIRELDNAIERAMILGDGEWIKAGDLPSRDAPDEDLVYEQDNLSAALDAYERRHIIRILEKTDGDKRQAADLMGISISSIYRKIEELRIDYRKSASKNLSDDAG
jgi:DNA-binding NtrC family response regulator